MRTSRILVTGFALALVALPPAIGAEPPGVNVVVEDGPKPGKTTYRFLLDRANAESFREAVVSTDAKKLQENLGSLTKDPAQKAIIGLLASNVEAFKRAMGKEGAIGTNGVEIVVVVEAMSDEPPPPLIPGRNIEGKRGPVRDFLRRAGKQVGEAVFNPWSWEVKPRN